MQYNAKQRKETKGKIKNDISSFQLRTTIHKCYVVHDCTRLRAARQRPIAPTVSELAYANPSIFSDIDSTYGPWPQLSISKHH